jgi:hypothetical protein
MTIRPEILDELLKNYAKPEDLTGEGGILKQLTKALVEGRLLYGQKRNPIPFTVSIRALPNFLRKCPMYTLTMLESGS